MGHRVAAPSVAVFILLLAGCTGPTAPPSAEERLSIDAIAPEATELTVTENETVTFVVTCQPPGLPEEVVVEWEQAIRGEGVEDRHQDFTSSRNESTFAVTFDDPRERIVTAVCTTDDDRTQPHVWNVSVEAGEGRADPIATNLCQAAEDVTIPRW